MNLFPAEIANQIIETYGIEQGGILHGTIGLFAFPLWAMTIILCIVALAGAGWVAYCVTRGLAAWAIEVIQARKGVE